LNVYLQLPALHSVSPARTLWCMNNEHILGKIRKKLYSVYIQVRFFASSRQYIPASSTSKLQNMCSIYFIDFCLEAPAGKKTQFFSKLINVNQIIICLKLAGKLAGTWQ
jgi:hypothetical protein